MSDVIRFECARCDKLLGIYDHQVGVEIKFGVLMLSDLVRCDILFCLNIKCTNCKEENFMRVVTSGDQEARPPRAADHDVLYSAKQH